MIASSVDLSALSTPSIRSALPLIVKVIDERQLKTATDKVEGQMKRYDSVPVSDLTLKDDCFVGGLIGTEHALHTLGTTAHRWKMAGIDVKCRP
jgi:hypothetical protein